jgi:hypothetical protein
MSINKKLAMAAAVSAAFVGFTQSVSAHTTMRENSTMEANQPATGATTAPGVNYLSGFNIPHGCDGLPVRAQGAVFPNGDSAVAYIDDGVATTPNTPVDLNDHVWFIPSSPGAGLKNLGPVIYQDKNTFRTITKKLDGTNRVRGVAYDSGYLQLDLTAYNPIRVTIPALKPTSCAKRLIIRIPTVNWCSKSQTDASRMDAWIGHETGLFVRLPTDPASIISENFWPQIVVNRQASNPVPAGCTPAEGYDVAVEPTVTDVDSYLPIPGYYPTP